MFNISSWGRGRDRSSDLAVLEREGIITPPPDPAAPESRAGLFAKRTELRAVIDRAQGAVEKIAALGDQRAKLREKLRAQVAPIEGRIGALKGQMTQATAARRELEHVETQIRLTASPVFRVVDGWLLNVIDHLRTHTLGVEAGRDLDMLESLERAGVPRRGDSDGRFSSYQMLKRAATVAGAAAELVDRLEAERAHFAGLALSLDPDLAGEVRRLAGLVPRACPGATAHKPCTTPLPHLADGLA